MDKSSLENMVNEINTEELIKEKLEAKISAEIDRRIKSGNYDDYINREVERRMRSDEVKKIIQKQVEDQIKVKLAEYYGTSVGWLFFDEQVHKT